MLLSDLGYINSVRFQLLLSGMSNTRPWAAGRIIWDAIGEGSCTSLATMVPFARSLASWVVQVSNGKLQGMPQHANLSLFLPIVTFCLLPGKRNMVMFEAFGLGYC